MGSHSRFTFLNVQKVKKSLPGILFIAVLAACGESGNDLEETAHLDRAKVYQGQGQYKAAIIEYKNAVQKSGGAVDVIVRYADMFNQLGHHSAALTLLEQVKDGQNEQYYLELVKAFLGMKKYMSAEATINEHLTKRSREVALLEANVQLGLEEFVKAGQTYDALLKIDSKDGEALLGKAQVLARTERIEQSATLLKDIPQKSVAYVKGRILKAGIEIARENLEAAESILSELLSRMPNTDIIEPEKAVVLERLSYVLTRQGRTNEAYIYTKLLAEAFPGANEANEQYNEAVEKFQRGDFDAANAILGAILDEYPRHKKAAQLSGIISYLRGDTETASKFLSDSVDPEVANPLATHIYAATNLKLNDPQKVLEILEPGIARSKIPQTLALYGLAAISDKQYSKGENALLKALEIEPDNVRIRLALAGLYRNSPNSDKSSEWAQLQKAYVSAPGDIQVLKSVTSYHLRHDGAERADQFIRQSLEKMPENYASNMIAGYLSVNQKQLEKALTHFTVASKASKGGERYLTALFAKGKTEIALTKIENAEKTFNALVKKFPESGLGFKGLLSVYILKDGVVAAQQHLEGLAKRNAKAAPYLVLTESALSRRDILSAKRFYDRAVELKADNRDTESLKRTIQYVEAVVAMQSNDLDKARDIIAAVLVAEPENLRVLSFLVDLELKAGQLKEAAKILQQLETNAPTLPVVSLLKGDLALANKDIENARTHYTRAWEDNPSEVAADKLFKVLSQLGDGNAQDAHLASWLKKFPDNIEATLYQAMRYQKSGQRNKAIEGYETVLKRSPDNVMVLNNLGWIYFEKNDDRALELLKKAVGLAPENAAVLDSYGWVLVKGGQVKEGLAYLEKANALAPDIQEIAEHLKEAKAL